MNAAGSDGMMGRRIGAFLIDWLVTGALDSALWIPLIMIPIIQRRIETQQIISRNLCITLVAFLYLLFRDLWDGRSIGKRCLGLQVRRRERPSLRASSWQHVVRNVFLILSPVEIIWFLATAGRTRLGDNVAGTTVAR
ncbi:MAG: RDD family protein, partial [Kiritimatiellae bacterium]|nr:RDD family protein [Kiritimatiellia bacterium]